MEENNSFDNYRNENCEIKNMSSNNNLNINRNKNMFKMINRENNEINSISNMEHARSEKFKLIANQNNFLFFMLQYYFISVKDNSRNMQMVNKFLMRIIKCCKFFLKLCI